MITLNVNGVELRGTIEQIEQLLNEKLNTKFDPSEWYFSQSYGKHIKIIDMNTEHLFNAFWKLYKQYFAQLEQLVNERSLSRKEAVKDICDFPEGELIDISKTLRALFVELIIRNQL